MNAKRTEEKSMKSKKFLCKIVAISQPDGRPFSCKSLQNHSEPDSPELNETRNLLPKGFNSSNDCVAGNYF